MTAQLEYQNSKSVCVQLECLLSKISSAVIAVSISQAKRLCGNRYVCKSKKISLSFCPVTTFLILRNAFKLLAASQLHLTASNLHH